ncbi:MAG TPA: class I SAM-dependent methyltransferase [Ktedonobacteraceae bacterium]
MPNPYREHPSTYMVQDRDNQEELTRLQLQDQMLTTSMGGVLPEQPDPTTFKRILDIGCGTGGWLIETAKTYPDVIQLCGVDINSKMLNYARAQAEANQVSDRIEFHVMDALHTLEFPIHFFDLVNMRLAQSWIRTWEWSKVLREAQRICKPGGVIRFTEFDFAVKTNSPALNSHYDLAIQAFYRAGHYFTQDSDAIITHLPRLMHQYGVQNIQTRSYTLEYRTGTPEGQFFIENMLLAYRTTEPFMKKWIRLPDDHKKSYQQALGEMQAPDFVATWQLLTAWGTNQG